MQKESGKNVSEKSRNSLNRFETSDNVTLVIDKLKFKPRNKVLDRIIQKYRNLKCGTSVPSFEQKNNLRENFTLSLLNALARKYPNILQN